MLFLSAGGLKSPVHTTSLGAVLNGDVKSEGTSQTKTEGENQVQGNSTSGANSSSERPPSGSLQNGVKNGEEETLASNDPPAPPTVADANETTPPQSSQPVIPPRPYRPPRPFPPQTGSLKSPTASPSHSAGSRHKNRTHKTHHGDPRSVMRG